MNYKFLAVLILPLLTINMSFAEEKAKKNYFSDDNYRSKEFKKNKTKKLYKSNQLESREKRSKRPRRVRLKTDSH